MTQAKLLVPSNETKVVKLNELTDNQLLFNTKESVRVETLSTQAVIKYLSEVNRRKLFLSMGYPSLLAFCMEELKYSETSALRRISAMRLIHQMPEIEQKLEEGRVSLTTLSQLSTFIRKEEKKKETKLDIETKKELLGLIENKTEKECEKEFIKLDPLYVKTAEKERLITEELTEIKMIIDDKLKAKLERLKNLLSHKNHNPSYSELIEILADIALKKLDPEMKRKIIQQQQQDTPYTASVPRHFEQSEELRQNHHSDLRLGPSLRFRMTRTKLKTTSVDANTTTGLKLNSRYIPSSLRQEIYFKYGGKCSYVNPVTNKKCESRYQLQIDHIHAYSKGGQASLDNLQLLCRNHNAWKSNR